MRLSVAIATWIIVASPPGERMALAQQSSQSRTAARQATAWSQGVPAASQEKALRLFREGMTRHEQAKYTEAVARYEQALALWDHPNIRFNMAICLINMRQPLVAWDHLQRALRFGDAPLGKRLYAEGLTYVAALEASLGQLTVRSVQPEVTVMVDGGQVLVGAGEHTMKVLAGKHQLVATRPGYVTASVALDVPAGKPVTRLISLAPVTVKVRRENYERRWAWWVPWSVAGGSALLGLAATGFYLNARTEMKAYDDALRLQCPEGCADTEIPASLRGQRTAAARKGTIAIALWSVAGAAAIAGGTMAILNRPRRQDERAPVASLTVTRDYVGVGVSLALE